MYVHVSILGMANSFKNIQNDKKRRRKKKAKIADLQAFTIEEAVNLQITECSEMEPNRTVEGLHLYKLIFYCNVVFHTCRRPCRPPQPSSPEQNQSV